MTLLEAVLKKFEIEAELFVDQKWRTVVSLTIEDPWVLWRDLGGEA